MAEIVTVDDLPVDLRSREMVATFVAGANARASRVAPCLDSEDPPPTDAQLAEAKLILIGAIQRWADAGSGAFTQQAAGPFSASMDTRQRSGFNLWPSEIRDLQGICANDDDDRQAFSIDTAPTGRGPGYWVGPDEWFSESV